MEKARLDAFLVTGEANIRYLSGFEGREATVVFTPRARYFVTDSRYLEDAKESVRGFKVMLAKHSIYETLAGMLKKDHAKKVGFEAMNIPYGAGARLKGMLGSRLVPTKEMVEDLRAVKEKDEISLIRESVSCAKKVLRNALKILKPGVSERRLCAEIEMGFLEHGADAAFQPIVAFNANTAKPHARPTEAILKRDGHAMIDLGCRLNGYNSDLTRMVFFGKVKRRIMEIRDIVRRAEEKAIDTVRPGALFSEIDLAARRYIKGRGFGRYFGHAVGHGVGLEVHEKPSVSQVNHHVLRPFMVFTIEPAIYLPGLGGIRLEDMVMVTDTGCDILTG